VNFWTPKPTVVSVGEATPLLQHLAGEFAARVAGLWRAPHAVFLTAPAERRHLVCLAVGLANDAPLPAPADELFELSMTEAIEAFIPHPPEGLRRALKHLGETAWASGDYRRLLELLGRRPAAKVLRHAVRIDTEQVRALSLLPDVLLRSRAGGFALSSHQAHLLVETWTAIRRVQGSSAAEQAALRWAGAKTGARLFEMAAEDLLPEPPEPPFRGTDRMRPLRTKAELRDAAGRYQNCLRDCIAQAVEGASVFYEWDGPPTVVLELQRDPLFGWRLNEARLLRNASVPPPARAQLTAELRGMGVHVGRTSWALQSELARAHEALFRRDTPEETLNFVYGD
jgi:hypothetical protein